LRLLRLEINGFKSFAHKVKVNFEPGITAIIGPNGSGKSNIVDAIRWVLGEQSAKSLRGNKMEDVIFIGSERRKPLGMAEVSLILDNSDGTLNLPYQEVCIRRRVFRSGEGEYSINGKTARLRDLTELFMNTGLGRDDYSIIDQRKVEAVLGSKPQDRRLLLEEAAGIYKYRVKREETLRKLAETEDNSLRLRDILSELTARLRPLRIEAARAQEAKKLDEEIARLSLWLLFQQFSSWQKIIVQTEAEKKEAEAALASAQKEACFLDEKVAELRELEEGLNAEIASLTERQGEEAACQQRREGDWRVGKERQKSLLEQKQRLAQEKEELEVQFQELSQRLCEAEEQRQKAEGEQNSVQEKLTAAEERLAQLLAEAEAGSELLEAAKSELIGVLEERAGFRNRFNSLEEEAEKLSLRLERTKGRLEEIAGEREELAAEEAELEGRRERLAAEKEQINSLENVNKERCHQAASELAALGAQLEAVRKKREQIEARHRALSEMERHFEGYYRGIRNLLERKNQLPGLVGPVAELIRVPPEFEVAVETALGGGLQNLVTEDDGVAQTAIALLRKNNWGRATFLPLNLLRPDKIKELPAFPGILGIASDLVSCDRKYAPAVEYLLGRTVVAEDLASATKFARRTNSRYRIVTLAGDLIAPGGAVSGGSREQNRTGLLARKRQLEELKEALAELELQLGVLQQEEEKLKQATFELNVQKEELARRRQGLHLAELELERDHKEYLANLARLARQYESAKAEEEELLAEQEALHQERQALARKIEELTAKEEVLRTSLAEQGEEQSRWQSQRLSYEQEISALRVQLGSLTERTEQLAAQKSELEQRTQLAESRLMKAVEAAEDLEDELQTLQETLDQLKVELGQLEEERQKLAVVLQEKNTARLELREALKEESQRAAEAKEALEKTKAVLHKYEVQLARLEAEGERLAEELGEKHQLTFAELSPESVPQFEFSLQQAQRELRKLGNERQQLGNVNFAAIEELVQVEERVSFLEAQLEDLQKARTSLLNLIEEIDGTSRQKLTATFNQVNQAFSAVFGRLFQGGRAHLELSAPEGEQVDPLTAGVEVLVQLPGKKQQNIQLLSGGERAFVAIAFLFSILKVHPSPFCVLDEIDAPLDEANLHRFSALLRDFVKKTQFIVVTHRRRTMEEADALYGVTMQEGGVSQLLSVRLEDAG